MANSQFSFIQFNDTIDEECDIALPISLATDLAFFFDDIDTIQYATKDGTVLGSATFTVDASFIFAKLTGSLHGSLLLGDCFRLKVVDKSASVWYSNLFRLQLADQTTLLKYYCEEPQFDFEYDISNSYNQLRLPIRIYEPQYPQKENVYIDTMGNRTVLFSKVDIEYLLETEYIPKEWHEKIIIALSHDHVLIDGVSMTKTEEYKINWDEYIDTDCNTRLTKGATKLQQNITYRNSNCG